MKNVIIGLLLIGLTSLGYAQNMNNKLSEMDLAQLSNFDMDGISSLSSNSLNSNYLYKVQDESMSVLVRTLEEKASNFNVKKSKKFDGDINPFKVVFKVPNGSIIVTYNNDGEILSSLERFKNIKLPEPVRVSIFKKYPNWSLISNSYLVSYNKDENVKKEYKVQIGKDNLKKQIKVDPFGNIK